MGLFKHIVVGTDFSQQADVAVQDAVYLARQHEAKLSILHVIDERAVNYQESLPLSPEEFETLLAQEAKRTLFETFGEDSLNSVDIKTIAMFGRPQYELSSYCQSNDVDLVVAGRRGDSPLKQVLLGSTAEKLMRQSPIPTLLVAHPEANGFKNVLAPVDGSEASRDALQYAVDFAKASGANLHILYVCESLPISPLISPHLTSPKEKLFGSYEEQMKEAFDEFLEDFDFGDFTYEAHFKVGKPAFEIVNAADSLETDLVIMGTVGRSGIAGLFIGNTAERVSRSLSCSILTVRPSEASSE